MKQSPHCRSLAPDASPCFPLSSHPAAPVSLRLLSGCGLQKCCGAVTIAQPDISLNQAAFVQVLDCLLVIDVILHFFRAYPNKKSVLVVELSKIRKNYLGDCCIRQLHCLMPAVQVGPMSYSEAPHCTRRLKLAW